ncbi:oxidative damage protection protein [Buchnera aphidicola]|uniref:oxidative damage protection protein n=1 Tax=Buchnera aphidicola TaxID=9 RepID=UPI00223722AB|nr:oxidative damage protection protein [Buchnera aphidicola]MCW5197456.1 oxidative damage protection protein [Buchnera aphidicola (Chaitophorus viminalis)]
MKREIYCIFFKKKMKGLKYMVYPGKLGEKIYKNISQKAWNKWIKKQTILINEKKLNMMKLKDQKIIYKKMNDFLFKTNTLKSKYK